MSYRYFAHFLPTSISDGIGRPSADVSTTGWTAVPGPALFDMVNETAADDADYMRSPAISTTPAALIQQLDEELPAGTYVVRIRADSTLPSGALLRVSLLDDANVSQGDSGDQTLTDDITTYELPVSTTGAATRIKYEVEGP